jgi:hypothetical protein
MRAMFANLTHADFTGRPNSDALLAKRLRVHALFDEIQVAIYNSNVATVDRLMAQLALATVARRPSYHAGDTKSITRTCSDPTSRSAFEASRPASLQSPAAAHRVSCRAGDTSR